MPRYIRYFPIVDFNNLPDHISAELSFDTKSKNLVLIVRTKHQTYRKEQVVWEDHEQVQPHYVTLCINEKGGKTYRVKFMTKDRKNAQIGTDYSFGTLVVENGATSG